ncbi:MULTISPECIES: hypothetical protein [unclassified Streptomyces]|uniref:hypothetical protein n=1 Tax=unclassified Streptomyces TaxID=2593676 RepID=UPI00036D5F9C|nr:MULTISPECIES: hypothetical protein [unclassified Streptomyces]MYT32914.1 hypothetical protein [Streptomyces sp. SID8354]
MLATAPLFAALPSTALASAPSMHTENAGQSCGGNRDAYLGTYRGTVKESTRTESHTHKIIVQFSKDRRTNYWATATVNDKFRDRSAYRLNLGKNPAQVEFNAIVAPPNATPPDKYRESFRLAAVDCPATSAVPRRLVRNGSIERPTFPGVTAKKVHQVVELRRL